MAASHAQFTGIHWTESIENCAQNAPNQLEFDIYLQFDGTRPNVELLAYAFGINYSTSILNGGTGSFTQVQARDAVLTPLATPNLSNVPGTSTNGGTLTSTVRITQSSRSPAGGVININPLAPAPSPKFFLGRFRLTTSVASFTANAEAGLSPQCASQVGRANFSAVYDTGAAAPSFTATSFSTNPPQPAMVCASSNSCQTLVLNPSTCPIASQMAGYTSCNLSPVTVTGSITNAADSTRWSTNGTGAFANNTFLTTTFTPGAAGDTIFFTAFGTGCAPSTAFRIYTNSQTTYSNVTTSACDSYQWPVTAFNYTVSKF